MVNSRRPPMKRGLTTQQTVLILGVALIVTIAVVAIILFRPKPEPEPVPEAAPMAGAQVMNTENFRQIEQEMTEKVERGMFQTYMNNVWRFPSGSSPSSNAVMGNSANNIYPFWFQVVLDDTGETVFTSGLLPVGTQIEAIKLEKELDPGEYAASVVVNMVDENNVPVESNAAFSVSLVIQG